MSVKVSTLMTEMPHTIGLDIEANKAQEMMSKYSCHHLPVLDGGKLTGVISDRDLQLLAVSGGMDLPISEIMSEDPVIVDRDETVSQVVKKMLDKHVHSVIVSAKDNKPWGIFTSTDALRYMVEITK